MIGSRSIAENMPFQCLDQLIWKTSVFGFFLFRIDDRPYVETPYSELGNMKAYNAKNSVGF
ncbi:MAG: hypothetical protein BA861_05245 [Desulfobacterales bacterium S3730MH5]|nr:MAG: hypothetical protein BA861_05245 [Desulfobacterales bacterium S3730MH5]